MSEPRQPELQIAIVPKDSAFASKSRAELVLRGATEAFTHLGDALKNSATGFLRALENARPDEIELELNLSLEAEGSWIIVSGKAGATAGVTLTWKRDKAYRHVQFRCGRVSGIRSVADLGEFPGDLPGKPKVIPLRYDEGSPDDAGPFNHYGFVHVTQIPHGLEIEAVSAYPDALRYVRRWRQGWW